MRSVGRATSAVLVVVQLLLSEKVFCFSSCSPQFRTRPGVSYKNRQVLPLRQHEQDDNEALSETKNTNNLKSSNNSESDENDSTIHSPPKQVKASKREMLGFAIPALGIYLSNPLLSNIDNAFVGRTVGTAGLAALSPATVCTDQVLYLFSFLSRATTGLVSRAYATKINGDTKGGNTMAAQQAGSAPLTVSLACGFLLSIGYALFTPKLLAILNVDSVLRAPAASYIYWRGAIAWAALAQSVCLSILMATRDAIAPLKIIALAALVNVCGDALLCSWPLRLGCSGAAAATSFATLVSSGFMVKALAKKKILPRLRIPTKSELVGLSEFTGPLLAITLTRLTGFVSMQRAAMGLGVAPLAAYQLSINLVLFFLLFGEPLSQLSQTKLPAIVDAQDGDAVLATFKSVLILGFFTALGIGSLSFAFLKLGAGLFSSNIAVQALAKNAAPAVFMAVATAILAVTVDGAMLASRDFGFMLLVGTLTCILQLYLLPRCSSIGLIYGTFTMRLGVYAAAAMVRAALGRGALGRAIRNRGQTRGTRIKAAVN